MPARKPSGCTSSTIFSWSFIDSHGLPLGTKTREIVPARVLEHPAGNKLGHFCSRPEPKDSRLLLFASSYFENLEDHAVLELFLLSSRLSR